MHPADLQAEACADSTIQDTPNEPHWLSTHSPQVVRALILATFTLGLIGLSLPGDKAAVTRIDVTSAAAHLTVTPGIRGGDIPVRHASRSRTTPPAAAPARKPAPRKAARSTPRKKTVSSGPRWVRPMGGGIDSAYGPRWGRMHKGIDYSAPTGTPIRAVGAGVVIGAGYLGSEGGYGKITIIRHVGGIYSAYAHQSRVAVSAGERVKAGEIIGYVGSTGHSTGPHLHFEIRTAPHGGQINPVRWMRSKGI